jgi:serine/threonine protein kinase
MMGLKKFIKNGILRQKYKFPRDFPTLAKDLVKKILRKNPKDRLSSTQILKHPWLKGVKIQQQAF